MGTIIITLIAAVVIILLFTVALSKKRAHREDVDQYICEICDEKDCVCHKEDHS
ncbi:hypothetical protein ACFLZM_00545 [Thermodesulfobacteriota bacterium]